MGKSRNKKSLLTLLKWKTLQLLKQFQGLKIFFVTKQLSKKQLHDFAIKWSTAKELGADKFAGKYTIVIYQKNKKERRFTINNNKIQESGWLTYDLVDTKYFDKLWKKCK